MKYTIIVTVYNKEKYLSRCLDSVCNQTYKNYSILIVNDGSTDNSEKIIKKYKDENNNIKYYYKENTGIANTRNFAVQKVETEYFLFVDADDYIELDLLENVDKYNNYDLLSFNAINLDESANKIKLINKEKFVGKGEEFFIKLVKNKSEFTVPWGYVYNTNYFRTHKFKYPDGNILEDYYLTPLIIIEAEKLISIEYKGYYYIENSNSIINSKENKEKIKNAYWKHFYNLNLEIEKVNCSEKVKKIYKQFLANTLIWYGSLLEKEEQKEYIKKMKDKKVKSDKLIVRILYKFNLYYGIRKIVKKIIK